ncbi:MAG: MraZ N-terminal domain-containing protein [Candidatus Aenigmatarchaeota archaeon]
MAKIDDKGRISLPADLRKSIGLCSGDILDIGFSLTEQKIFLKKGVGYGAK